MWGRGARTGACFAAGALTTLALAASPATQAAERKPGLRDLSRSEAVTAARDGFGAQVTEPLWKFPTLKSGERVTSYRGDRVAVIDRPGTKTDTIVDSTVPLVTRDVAGATRRVDVGLERRGSRFAPRNAAADSSYASSLGGGFSLASAGVTVRPALPNANAAGQLTGDRVFYANAAADTDVLVGAHPTGFEVFFQLRSAASPEALPLAIEGAGLSLRRSSAVRGGAEVLRAGRVVAQIAPPTAVDAAKRRVPVSYRISGTTLEVVARHVKRKVQYPILVDPHVMDQQLWFLGPGYGIGNWNFETPWPNNFWGSQAGAWGRGLYLVSGAPNYYYGGGSWSWWRYSVPGSAHAFRADFNPVVHQPTQPGVCITLGFQRGGVWTGGGKGENVSTGANLSSPISQCGAVQSTYYRACTRPDCMADPGQFGNTVGFQQWINGYGVRSTSSYSMLAGVTVFLEDYDDPNVTGAAGDNAAFGPDHPWSYSYTQDGLGVSQVVVDSPTAPYWDQAGTKTNACFGTPWSRCPTADGGGARYGNLTYGPHQIRVRAYSPTGRVGTWLKNVHIGYYWASWRYGGANHALDTQAEVDAAINALSTGTEQSRDVVWGGLSDADKATVVAADGYVRWGEEPPLNAEGEDGTYQTWDGEGGLNTQLDTWIPAADQEAGYDQIPAAQSSAGPIIIIIIGGCKAFCDDAIKKGVSPIFKRVIKSKKPRPKIWTQQKPWVPWTVKAGRNPSRNLGTNLGTRPAGSSSDWAAHHIVPVGHRGARVAQEILENCGIHPNSAVNGVWLPSTEAARQRLGSSRPAHSRLHTTHYVQNVNTSLFRNKWSVVADSFSSCDRVKEVLRLMKEQLIGNKMPF